MVDKVIVLPEATLRRLYHLAHHRHASPDRVIEDLIDDASQGLSLAVWEQAQDHAAD
jgi:hypothetical protein